MYGTVRSSGPSVGPLDFYGMTEVAKLDGTVSSRFAEMLDTSVCTSDR